VLDAVRLIARGEPMTKLPREAVLSVSRGCQILVDQGIAMRPFAEDTRQLVGSLRTAVGNAHTRVLSFVDSPQRGVLTEEYEDERYTPPDNGALVLAVSDLCSGGPRGAAREGDPREWLMLANAIHDAGSSLVVLNPYPPVRWPGALLGRIPIVHWDRSTDVAGVRRTRRRSRR
jgi:hypothetical protein